MTNEILAKELKNGMFSSRKNVAEALTYAYDLIETMNGTDKMAAFTALHVVLNTLANQIEKNEVKEM